MKAKFIFWTFCLLLINNLTAQQRECATMSNLEYRSQIDPNLQKKMLDIESYTQRKIQELQSKSIEGNIITIPVVVHVIYSNPNENISDAQIVSQIQVLNDDFRRTNLDADGVWSQAADTEIEFCLASVDMNGNSTNGITRKSSTRTSWGTNDDMKSTSQGGVDPWDTSQYLNMWVCNIGGGILGYAQFPGGNASTDGVVMGPQYFGSKDGGSGFYLSAPFDLGRTTTHEVGHFLNLRHIWGDGNCNADDGVTDTPTSDGANYGCASGTVSCSSVDMVQNYMDYSDDGCMNLYTQGQTNRMRVILLPGGVRASLGASNKCDGGGVIPTCSDGIQNGNETGVDCGGSTCEPCQIECNENLINVLLTFDQYPEETAWTITDTNDAIVASGSYSSANPDGSSISESLNLPNGFYEFTITDSYGDGICCTYGNGSYSVSDASGVFITGGSFGSSESTQFCIDGTSEPSCGDGVQNGDETGIDCGGSNCEPCELPPSCDDGIQNGDETGTDCGGSSCEPCNSGGTVIINEGYFETGWDNWEDGGSDCARYTGSFSTEGTYSIRLRDNSGIASSMTLNNINLSSFAKVTISFSFYANSMENGEDFWLQFNDGSGFSTIATYARGTSFPGNGAYTASFELLPENYNFVSNAGFRFRCDASGNNDQIYIDEVVIFGELDGPDSTPPVITLNGASIINLNLNSTYTEQGATATDNIDGNLSGSINISGTVNTSAAGTYFVAYNVSDTAGNAADTVIRTVNVIQDTTPPIITLVGSSNISLEQGDTYSEQGATAIDNVDGDISDSITIGGDTINTSVVGSYDVLYSVSDGAGNFAQVSRTVVVSLDTTAPLIILNGFSEVNLNVGDTYSESGATAQDNFDGDLTADIVIDNPVNTSIAGTYLITYDVSDAAGNNAATVTRTVVVIDEPTGPVILNEGYFETGLDGWIDGGSDCARVSNSAYAFEGNYSIRIRDNSGVASSMTLSGVDLTSYTDVQIDFHFYVRSMENGEDFWLRYFNGSIWETVATWTRGVDINNNTFYSATIVLSAAQYNLSNNSGFRFQNDASGNNDQIFIDQVVIKGLNGGARLINNKTEPVGYFESRNTSEYDVLIFPNPVSGNHLNIVLLDYDEISYRVINMLGQTVDSGQLKSQQVNVENLESGMYFIEINDGDEVFIKKFIRR
ncbi:DUF5011 domain-containing protein [Flavobacteriaceae bacterium]|jgi:hypothetical protein|nr:DUF5011 domain-containing protein [Flavobacteriaceae bacterium]